MSPTSAVQSVPPQPMAKQATRTTGKKVPAKKVTAKKATANKGTAQGATRKAGTKPATGTAAPAAPSARGSVPASATAPHDLFAPAPGYLNAATMGLPPRATADAVRQALDVWQRGGGCPAAYDVVVNEARALYADLVGVPTSWVATGSQVSVAAGVVATSLPPGARVVCVDGDFSSMVYPFLAQADRGVQVRHVPLAGLADAVAQGCDLVSFSLAQSADGQLADADAVVAAATEHGALTFCDVTQAAGWYDVDASRYDITTCTAYKWLCSPRGTAFTTMTPAAAERLTPIHAGWYAGESVFASCYGPQIALAHDARRFDVSPAWLSWVGTVPSLRMLAGLDAGVARWHGAGLADALRERLDLGPQGRPVLSLPDPDGVLAERLEGAGCTVAGRAGLVRIAFHLWNDEQDVDVAARALAG